MLESRQVFQTTSTPYQSQELNEWQRQSFRSDDDLLLPISVYLESGEGHAEIIADVMQAVRTYGFTNVVHASQAPGSFFFRMEVGFESKDHRQAQQQKRRLTKALLDGDNLPDSTPQERRAVKKVKQSLRARLKKLKKKISAITIGSVLLFAGHQALEAGQDAAKDVLKDVMKGEAKTLVQKVDTFIAKELPPAEAHRFHNAVKNFIDDSPDKAPAKPTSKKPRPKEAP